MGEYKIPKWIRRYVVEDIKSVEELLNKYSKTFNKRTQEYHDAMLSHHIEDFEKYGYDFINHHDSTTGCCVAILNSLKGDLNESIWIYGFV